MRQAEFNDPRLVTLYDAEDLWSRDDEFFLAAVNEAGAGRVSRSAPVTVSSS